MVKPESAYRGRPLSDHLSERARLALLGATLQTGVQSGADLGAVLAQYQLYVEMADRISSRRQTANNFFLSISSALVGFGSMGIARSDFTMPLAYLWANAIVGLFVSLLWWRLITSYRDLNSAKFKVVHAIESLLPVKPYRAEWSEVGGGRVSRLYLPVTHAERVVPIGFAVLHLVLAGVVTLGRLRS